MCLLLTPTHFIEIDGNSEHILRCSLFITYITSYKVKQRSKTKELAYIVQSGRDDHEQAEILWV